MRRFTTALSLALAERSAHLTRAVIFTPKNGEPLRFTELDEPLVIEGDIFWPGRGLTLSGIPFTINVSATRMDIRVVADPDGTVLNFDHLRFGVYDNATVEVYLVDFTNPDIINTATNRSNLLFYGNVGEVAWDSDYQAVLECEGIFLQSTGTITEVYTPVCRADFGDRRCRVPVMGEDPVAGREYLYGEFIRQRFKDDGDPTDYPHWLWMCTVSGVSGDTIPDLDNAPATDQVLVWGDAEFQAKPSNYTRPGTVDSVEIGDTPDRIHIDIVDPPTGFDTFGYYRNGMLIFRTGALAGKAYEIANSLSGTINLFIPLEIRPAYGDWVEIYPGCDHSPGPQGNAKYDNILNYRGEPFAPQSTIDFEPQEE